jgi:hypothetical protein
MRNAPSQLSLNFKGDGEFPYDHLLPKIVNVSENVNVWEVDQTIGQLSYLTHNYFRYYGKFPSTVAGQLVKEFASKKNSTVIDNYSGSGTTLVEASRRGVASVGIDISPIAALAGLVKTEIYCCDTLRRTTSNLKTKFKEMPDTMPEEIPEKWIEKWFTPEAAIDLEKIRTLIRSMGNNKNATFFTIAFLAIIRRVSKAFDGEVRPHINKDKKQRSVWEAFEKKCRDMVERQVEFNTLHPERIPAQVFSGDSSKPYSAIIPDRKYNLVVSHPPYLNCFDYIQVFSQEFQWSLGLPCVWDRISYEKFYEQERASEIKTTVRKPEDVSAYYEKLRQAYENTYDIQPKGGTCAIVVGDCKIKSKVEPVHKNLIEIVTSIGYVLKSVNYRETHYATGKYSYDFRADYHGESAEKRDAILIFGKP